MYWAGDWEAGPTRLLYVFQQILGSKLLEDFPRLRVGFLEAGSEWAGVSSGDCAQARVQSCLGYQNGGSWHGFRSAQYRTSPGCHERPLPHANTERIPLA